MLPTMRNSALLSILLLFLGSFCLMAHEEVHIEADEVDHGVKTGITRAKGRVAVRSGDMALKCDEAEVDQTSGDFTAKGNVEVTVGQDNRWSAPVVRGNFQRRAIAFGPYRFDGEVWHAGGDGGETAEDGRRVLHNAWISTCDCEKPHYAISAGRIVYNEQERTFVADKAVFLRLFGVPVLYLPALYGSMDNSTGFLIKPGYSGQKGAYLRLGRVWKHGGNGDTQAFVDFMSKRGIALGAQSRYESVRREIAADAYGLHDLDPAETSSGWDRRFRSQDDRYRLHLYWREALDEAWTLRLNFDRLSDISMLEDWFRRDYRQWRQPKSFLSLDYNGEWFDFAVEARPRVNTFYTVGERLPELRLNVPQMRLDDSLPFTWSSENSAGYYTMKWRNNDRPRADFIDPLLYDETIHGDPADYRSFRADTLHTFKAPLDLGDIVTLTPRASFRATAYSRTSKRRMTEEELADAIDADNPDRPRIASPVFNYDSNGGSRTRFAAEFGVELQTKLIGDWMETTLPLLELNGVRHVVEPYVNYTFAPEPSVNRDYLYFFDEIDRLTRQNFFRLGVDQRWQTRDGQGGIRTFLSWENYIDLHCDRGDETGKYPGDWGSRLTFAPRSDLRFRTSLLYDVGAGDIQRGEVAVRYGAENDWQYSARYVYRNEHLSRSAYSMGSDLADFTGESSYIKKHFESADTIGGSINIPINSITSLEINAEYDFERNRLAEHSYYLTRRLHCWTLVAGVEWDYGDFAAMVMLRLTAFPNVKLDLNI